MAFITLENTEVFDSIRGLLSLSLTATDLPNATIFNHAFFKQAERKVESAYPDASTATGITREKLVAAVEFYTAADLLLIFRDIVAESFLNISRRYTALDVESLRKRYLDAAKASLADVVGATDEGLTGMSFFEVVNRR